MTVTHALEQSRTAPLETTTPGYTRVDAEVSHTWSMGPSRTATFFVQGRNLLNDDVRLSTSFIKDAAPQPGRSVFAGLRLRM